MTEPGVTCYMERVYPWIIGGLVLLLFVREVAWRLRMRRALREQAQQAVERSRSVLKGQIGEQLAPFLPGFPFHPGDVRFLGGIVDLVVFSGYHAGHIDEIVLVDVKSGGARLTPLQRQVEQAVADGKVRFATVRVE